MTAATANGHYHTVAQRLSLIFGYIAFGLGLWGLIGWKFLAPHLDNRTVKLVLMAPVACVLYILAGMTLWAFQEKRNGRFDVPGAACGVLVLIISGSSLISYFFSLNLNLGMESAVLWLLGAQASAPVLFTTVITARIGLIIIAAAILLLLQRRAVWHTAAHIAVSFVCMAGLASLIGYLYVFSPLYFAIESRWIVALPSAIALVSASLGAALLRPERGLIPVFIDEGIAGAAARRSLLFGIAVPFAVGALLAYAQRITRIPAETSILLFAIAMILLSFILVYWNGRTLRGAEEALRDNQQRYERLFNARIYGVAHCRTITDEHGKPVNYEILKVNDTYLHIIGIKREDIEGKLVTDVFPGIEDMPTGYIRKYGTIALEGGETIFEDFFPATNQWLEIYAYQPRYGEFAAIFSDITKRKRAEEALRQSEETFNAFFNASPATMDIFDKEYRYVKFNKAVEKFFNKPAQDILGRSVEEIAPGFLSVVREPFEAVLRTGAAQPPMEIQGESPREPGLIEYFLLLSFPVPLAGGERGIGVVAADITRSKRAEEGLRKARDIAERRAAEAEESRRILDALMDNIPEGIMVTDEKGSIRGISRYLSRISGHEKREVLGKNYQTLDALLHEPAALIDRRQGERNERHKTGTAVAEAPLALEYPLGRALEKGEATFNEERTIYLPDGTILTAVLNATPFRDAEGRIVGAVTSWLDITDRKKTEEALKVSNRELEQFAYVASHDLQEPLRMVTSFTELFERRYKELVDERGKKYVRYIVDGASRMQNLIQDLLAFSRVGRLDTERRRVDLNRVVDNVITDLSEKIKEARARVTRDPLPSLNANETALGRVFLNLVSNAIKFRKKEVPPEVHISAQRSGSEWRFSVRDNGIGIDPKYFGKLFVIFQRLHGREEYPGTGMGLAISKKIVENYGGRVWVESQPGAGSTFFFTIPH